MLISKLRSAPELVLYTARQSWAFTFYVLRQPEGLQPIVDLWFVFRKTDDDGPFRAKKRTQVYISKKRTAEKRYKGRVKPLTLCQNHLRSGNINHHHTGNIRKLYDFIEPIAKSQSKLFLLNQRFQIQMWKVAKDEATQNNGNHGARPIYLSKRHDARLQLQVSDFFFLTTPIIQVNCMYWQR